MVWDADEQRLQLTEEVGYDRWQFVYDTAAGIPAALVQRKADMDNETLGVTFHVREPGGELLASFESGGAVRYYHFDALGSTVLLSDGSGNATSAYAYGAWGDVLASPASWQPYQYVGQLGYYTHTTAQGSELADWLQLGVRFYQPEIGRFERRDQVVQVGESGYLYAQAAPPFLVDPRGEASIKKDSDYYFKKCLRTCKGYGEVRGLIRNPGIDAILGGGLGGAVGKCVCGGWQAGGIWGAVAAACAYGISELCIGAAAGAACQEYCSEKKRKDPRGIADFQWENYKDWWQWRQSQPCEVRNGGTSGPGMPFPPPPITQPSV